MIGERSWFIYALYDPKSPDEVRYVGWTTSLKRRLRQHRSLCKEAGSDKTWCGRWKRALLLQGVKPEARILQSGSGGSWQAAEVHWIAHYRSLGHRLTNITSGGDGAPGRVNSPEHRAAISAYRRGRKASDETRVKLRESHLGVKLSAEQVAKISAANRGRIQPPEERAKRRGKKRPPEAVEKTAAARRGLKHTVESRAKMRASHLGIPLPPGHKARRGNMSGRTHKVQSKAQISESLKAYHARRRLLTTLV